MDLKPKTPPPDSSIDEVQPDLPQELCNELTSHAKINGAAALVDPDGPRDQIAGFLRKVIRAISKSQVSFKHTFRSSLEGSEPAEALDLMVKNEGLNLVDLANRLAQGNWSAVLRSAYLRPPQGTGEWNQLLQRIMKTTMVEQLALAYQANYVGGAATDLIAYLKQVEAGNTLQKVPLYAKVISVVQSSGTGKSRMLTEVGRKVFTLPICLRDAKASGFPLGDDSAFDYFHAIQYQNDLSFSAHEKLALFLTAAYEKMLQWLKDHQAGRTLAGLRALWHETMEGRNSRQFRQTFFTSVVASAKAKVTKYKPGGSPHQIDDTQQGQTGDVVRDIYQRGMNDAVANLLKFIQSDGDAICVTYFDEAHELGLLIWILLRLIRECSQTRMWFIFMGTKSSISYYSPSPDKHMSLRLRGELESLLPPYISLGFDQKMINHVKSQRCITMGEIQSVEHLSRYGRPLWNSQQGIDSINLIHLAALKLTAGKPFNPLMKNEVFSVLSQRLCLEPVMTSSEAVQLADRSVSHHMRLITGFSQRPYLCYTFSPSEPVLALGAAELLYNVGIENCWPQVLDTFSRDLCSAGLVDKGILGELAARILLLLARDYASFDLDGRVDLLRTVPLLEMLDQLFGNESWAGNDRANFKYAFHDCHVNFTHWMVTEDYLPTVPDPGLLPNLWCRGAALQCSFNQEAIDCLLPFYKGTIVPEHNLDPTKMSAVVIQIKFKQAADTKAEGAILPLGFSRDTTNPHPYLAILMELGNTSNFQKTKSRIQVSSWKSEPDKSYAWYRKEWSTLHEKLARIKVGLPRDKTQAQALEKKVAAAKKAVDNYNRFAISARSASAAIYGILESADIKDQFSGFLSAVLPSPAEQDPAMQYMRPLRRLRDDQGYTKWMLKLDGGCSCHSAANSQ